MALIFVLSAQSDLPGVPGLDRIDWADKIEHAAFYAVLGGLLWRAFGGPRTFRICAGVVLLTLAYGLSDEIHQLYVPGRQFDMLDLAADGTGAIVGSAILAARLGGGILGRRAGTGEDRTGAGEDLRGEG